MSRKTKGKRPKNKVLKHKTKMTVADTKRMVTPSNKRTTKSLTREIKGCAPRKPSLCSDSLKTPIRRVRSHSASEEGQSDLVSVYIPSDHSPGHSSSIINRLREEDQNLEPFQLSAINMFRLSDGRIRDLGDPENFDNFMKSEKKEMFRRASKLNCCSCVLSNCLKKYCECFKISTSCSQACKCIRCKNPFGGKPKDPDSLAPQKCTCLRSGCDKNYCRCFKSGVPCGERCECKHCSNKLRKQPENTSKPKKGKKVELQVKIEDSESEWESEWLRKKEALNRK